MVAKSVLDEIVLQMKGSKDHSNNTAFPYREKMFIIYIHIA